MDQIKLYRYFDKEGTLLYIGITSDEIARMVAHRGTKHWYKQVTRIDLEFYDSLELAMLAEKKAIHSEKPLHNKRHNSTDLLKIIKLQPKEGECLACGKKITSIRKSRNPKFTQRFCSKKCRIDYWTATHPRPSVPTHRELVDSILTTAEKPLV